MSDYCPHGVGMKYPCTQCKDAELAATKTALRLAVKEIENHHSDPHHLTFPATLEKIRAPLGSMEEE